MSPRCLRAVVLSWGLAASAAAQPSGGPVTLADALARARESSPVVAAAQARLEAARDAQPRAGRLLNPLVELRSENWASGAPGGLPLDVFATVTQTVELGGKRDARRAVAGAAYETAAATAAIAWRDVALAVTTDYLAAVRAAEHARALTEHAASLTEAVRVMGRRVDVGAAPEADLLKLRTEEARVVMDRTRAEVALARALAVLGARIGVDVAPSQLQRPAVPMAAEPVVSPAHPEVRAADSALAAARATSRAERARRMPDLGVNAGVKRTSGFNTGVAAFTMPIPIFDTNGVARAIAEGQVRAAEQERMAVERRLRGTLTAATTAARALRTQAADAERTLVVPARGARDAARAAFATGALDVMRLVDAERVVIDAERVAIDIEIDAVAAAIEARLAAGEEPLP